MIHPLYPVARRMVGRPVYVHHVTGRVHYGLLQSVAPHGIYVTPLRGGAQMMSASETSAPVLLEDLQTPAMQPDLVYSPGGYFAFGALTGLTLGALAFAW